MAYEDKRNYAPTKSEGLPYKLLHHFNNWVAFEIKHNPDNPAKPKKSPVNPKTSYGAKANDPSTWGTYEEACAMAEQLFSRDNLGVGIGFELGESPFIGLDIDHCINERGELNEVARDIIEHTNTYTEISPSGHGLHLFFDSEYPLSAFSNVFSNVTGRKNDKVGVELYDSGRYFTFTGNVWYKEFTPPKNDYTGLRYVIARYFEPESDKSEAKHKPVRAPESDSELWEKMFSNPKNGADIQRLYDGDISGYDNDDSRADSALCFHLAYYTNNDESRMDSMFRQSRLMRAKWDEKHGAKTYGQMTIEKAIGATPEYISTAPTGDKEQQQTQQVKSFIMDAQYLADSFESDITHFQRYSNRKTGFSNLDDKITLYPGLYVVGAISSLGKTTFCLQLADQLAESGEHVLYFAFEQTRFELISKSLARMCQPEDSLIESLPTAIQIRRGRTSPEVREAMQKYSKIGRRKAIIECDFETDISTVIATVESYIKTYTVKPVVFVDYMQLIRSNNPRLTNTKDIVDNNIRALKKLQMQNELLMFVVSSINRMNYLTPIDFESFKESGAIEYTADVVIGLQLAVMNNKLFETDTKTTKKRRVIKAAKTEKPRNIELCVLKNRYGVSNESFYFEYYPQLEFFNPVTSESASRAITKLINSIPDSEEKKPR